MNEIIEKYEAKLAFLNKAIEAKKPMLDQNELEILAELKTLLKEIVTDLRAIRSFTNEAKTQNQTE